MTETTELRFPDCDCLNHDYKLRSIIARNGTRQYAIFCLTSGWRGAFVRKATASTIASQHGKAITEIPVHKDNRPGCCGGRGCATCSEQCVRCGGYERVEWHHWAPYHLFSDANDWPCSPLCRRCHTEWHNVVTPNMHLVRRAG